jgi:hypothetical protein
MSPKRGSYDERRFDPTSVAAWLFAMAIIASMFWMGVTRNKFCCDPKSLVGQLRQQLFEKT